MGKYMVTKIRFLNENGKWDETEFDSWDEHEVAALFLDFLEENGLVERECTFEDEPVDEDEGVEYDPEYFR